MISEQKEATVVTLVAEVRVLMAGSRQITLSVFRQLDKVDYSECEPMGRVNHGEIYDRWIVGKHKHSGSLVRAEFRSLWEAFPVWDSHDQLEMARLVRKTEQSQTLLQKVTNEYPPAEGLTEKEAARLRELESIRRDMPKWQDEFRADVAKHFALPLIVLAGLK